MDLTRKFAGLATASVLTVIAVNQAEGQVQARLRPIGSASAVDAFAAPRTHETQVSRMQVAGDNGPMAPPSLPPGGFAFPSTPMPQSPGAMPPSSQGPSGFALPPAGTSSSGGLPVPLQSAPVGPIAPPRTEMPPAFQSSPVAPPQAFPSQPQSLPINPNLNAGPAMSPSTIAPRTTTPSTNFGTGQSFPAAQPSPNVGSSLPRQPASTSASDYAAIPPPQLNNAFATMDNCRNISGPSSYRASGAFGCGAPSYGAPSYGAPVSYVPPPAQIAPLVALPPGATFTPASMVGSVPPVMPGNPGYRPLISLGQESNPVQVGQGIIGQPVAYVPGQCFRNALRYISF
jgi:hypothetical protein